MSRFAAKHVPQLGFAKATQPDFRWEQTYPAFTCALCFSEFTIFAIRRGVVGEGMEACMAAHCLRGMKWKSPGNMSGDCEEQVNGSQSLIVLPAKKIVKHKKKKK